jgi:hypothetical protein
VRGRDGSEAREDKVMISEIIEVCGIRCEVDAMPKPKLMPARIFFEDGLAKLEFEFWTSSVMEIEEWAERAFKQAYHFYLAGEH